MVDRICWGILGTGSIAHQFARGLAALPDADLVAVGSRAQATADTFADEFNVPHRHASYDALARDPEIDAIYVATPHSVHKDNSILCLRAGKAVLCEKPLCVNKREAQELIQVAREERRFLMEAMWTRFLPTLIQTRQWLAEGAVGEARMVQADFGFRANPDPKSRLFDPHFGGGGLLDVGVYAVSFASMVFASPPIHVTGVAHIGETEVDEQGAAVLGYDGGGLALVASAVRTNTPQEAWIMGTEGRIRLHAPFWKGTKATLFRQGKDPEDFEFPLEGNGYNYEAAAVAECLRQGKLECEVMPHDESLAVMETMDRIRAEWGLVYPMDAGDFLTGWTG